MKWSLFLAVFAMLFATSCKKVNPTSVIECTLGKLGIKMVTNHIAGQLKCNKDKLYQLMYAPVSEIICKKESKFLAANEKQTGTALKGSVGSEIALTVLKSMCYAAVDVVGQLAGQEALKQAECDPVAVAAFIKTPGVFLCDKIDPKAE